MDFVPNIFEVLAGLLLRGSMRRRIGGAYRPKGTISFGDMSFVPTFFLFGLVSHPSA